MIQHPNPPLEIKQLLLLPGWRRSLGDVFQDSFFDVGDVEVVDGDVVVFEGFGGQDVEFVVEG